MVSGPLRGGLLAAAMVLAAFPAACGARREDARLAALEAGMASARASLSVLSSPAPSAPPATVAAAPPPPAFRVALPRPSPAAGARPLSASELVGAGPDALRRWFGDPDLRRPEGDADVMLFLGSGCALDVVLYAEAGAKRVAHAAARADGPAAVTEADCLRGIGRGGLGPDVAGGHTPRR